MNIFGNNASRSGSTRRTVPSDLQATGDLSQAARIANARAPRAGASSAPRRRSASSAAPAERGSRASQGSSRGQRRGVVNADAAYRSGRASRSGSGRASTRRGPLMRYASDNRVVRALYTITAGPFRLAFYLAVIAVVGISLYFPVRDLYTAHRTGEILRAQLAIREAYNNKVQSDVDKLLSTEGIEDTARQNLGLVKPGETAINVVGLDDAEDASAGDAADGSDAAATTDGADAAQADAAEGDAQTANEDGADAGESADAASASVANDEAEENAEPTTSAEALAAEEAVAADAPWYVHMLDTFFCYTGVNGQKVASTGTSS